MSVLVISMWHGAFPKNDVRKGKLTVLKGKCQHREMTSVLCCHVQEAFFGKDLLDKSKQSRQQGVESGLMEEGQSQVERRHPTTSFLDPSSNPLLSTSTASLPARPAAARTYTITLVVQKGCNVWFIHSNALDQFIFSNLNNSITGGELLQEL